MDEISCHFMSIMTWIWIRYRNNVMLCTRYLLFSCFLIFITERHSVFDDSISYFDKSFRNISWVLNYVLGDLIKNRIINDNEHYQRESNEDMKFNDNDIVRLISSKKLNELNTNILTNIYFYTIERDISFIIRRTNDFALRDISYTVPYEEYCINYKRYFF